ncbi:MAG: hypothetical protein AB1Z21_01010 [Synechococcaceae cyanobacterium]
MTITSKTRGIMTIQHAGFQGDPRLTQDLNQDVQGMARVLGVDPQGAHVEVSFDPVEAYFECITTCSLDDGECITTCTELLREQV